MRIVHEFYSKKPQCTGSGHHYAYAITQPPEYRGFRAELLAIDAKDDGNAKKDGDALYLEGDAAALRAVLTELLNILDTLEEACKEDFAKEAASVFKCSKCKRWRRPDHNCVKSKKS